MGRGISVRTRERLVAVYAYAEENNPVTVRGCCYHLFTRGLIESMAKRCTAEISRILVKAREDGELPWDWIVDETRGIEIVSSWTNPADYGETVLRAYRKDRWHTQGTTVELWSEKGTIRGLLAPIIDRYQLPVRVMHGYSSATEVKDAAAAIEAAEDGGKDFVALYCGDWDPSGLDMSERDLPKRLERYGDGAHFKLYRIALIKSDLAGLPSFPLETKKDDSRFPWYRDNYHPSICWELDAMSPVALRQRVEHMILNFIDEEKWKRADRIEKAERESIRQFADALKSL
jgi:hypothetical protein